MSPEEGSPPAGGQTVRLPGVSRDAALHDQLYRYAEDMSVLLQSHSELEQRYCSLRDAYVSATEGRTVFEGMIQSSRDIYLMTDRAGIILQCNPAAAAIAPAPGASLVGVFLGELVAASHRQRFGLLLEEFAQGGEPPADELELHLSGPERAQGGNAALLITSVCAMPVKGEGELRGIHWLMRDVTRARETEFESQISSLVYDSAFEGVLITDLAGDILAVNPAFTRITGYSAEEVVGRNPRLLKSGAQDRQFYDDLWHTLRTQGRWQGEIRNRKKSGEIYPEWLTLTAARDGEGKVLSYIAVFSDLSRLMSAEKRLFHLAHHDTLTGLPNRQLFQDRLQQAIGQARRRGEAFSVMFIDLDRFKPINDTLGHAVGDLVLREVARRLTASIRAVDTIARFGGDEFVILAPGLSGEHGIGLVADKVIGALLTPISVEGHDLIVGASIGCAVYPEHGDDGDALLRHADRVMYQAKQSGGNTHAIYRGAEADAGRA